MKIAQLDISLDWIQKNFISSLHAVCFVVLPKKFLASMEVTEAAEATEAKKFQKISMPQNA